MVETDRVKVESGNRIPPARPSTTLMTILAVIAGLMLVLVFSYVPTVFVGSTSDIRVGAQAMVVFFVVILLLTCLGIWLVSRGPGWQRAMTLRLQTGGRAAVQRVMYWSAASALVAIAYSLIIAFNPNADWRYGIYLAATVLPILLIACGSLLLLRVGDARGKLLARVNLIVWPLAFLVFGNFLGLAYALVLMAGGLWALHGLKVIPQAPLTAADGVPPTG